MAFYYRNMYVSCVQNFTMIFYCGQMASGPFWFNVTDTFSEFVKSGDIPSTDDLDIFIFDYELKSGIKPYVYETY